MSLHDNSMCAEQEELTLKGILRERLVLSKSASVRSYTAFAYMFLYTHQPILIFYIHNDGILTTCYSLHSSFKEFRGSADPLCGDEFNRRVRQAAKVSSPPHHHVDLLYYIMF